MFRFGDYAGKEDTFSQSQSRRFFGKVEMRGFGGTIDKRSPFNDIQIDFKHTFFCGKTVTFYQPDNQHLFQLTGNRLIAAQKNVFHQLHT